MGWDGERSDEELVLGAVGSRLALERGCSMRSIAMTGCTNTIRDSGVLLLARCGQGGREFKAH